MDYGAPKRRLVLRAVRGHPPDGPDAYNKFGGRGRLAAKGRGRAIATRSY